MSGRRKRQDQLDVPPPGPASTVDAAAVRLSTLRKDPAVRRMIVWPSVVALLALAASLVWAPAINASNHGQFSDIFGTTAQVTATLFVALAVEARALSVEQATARRLVTGGTLGFLAVGLISAVLALNPTLSECAYRVLFGLSMGAGIGALLSVIAIAYHLFDAEFARVVAAAAEQVKKGN